MPSSRRSSQPKDGTQVSDIKGDFFTIWTVFNKQWKKLLYTKNMGFLYQEIYFSSEIHLDGFKSGHT